MTPQEFIVKWKRANLSERSAAQQHFLDLCELLTQPKPAAADPEGVEYTFEKGVSKTDGGDGWADVWWKGRFGWEYKGKHKDLKAAYQQLLKYRESLENPPLLVVCDLDRFEVHTNFTGTIKQVHAFNLDGLSEPKNLDILRRVFADPDSLKPGVTTAGITEDASKRFGTIAESMRDRGIEPHAAARFLMKLIFCMFAEDIGLLPEKLFSKLLNTGKGDPKRLTGLLKNLFTAMASGGDFGADSILWFNGGLFSDPESIELTWSEIEEVSKANAHNWADVEPSIFGTLFERTLDPAKRSQIGAHYTSREDILTLIEPVVMQPLRREWATVREQCDALWPKIQEESRKAAKAGTTRRKASKPRAAFDRLLTDFVHHLSHVRILDPACGSGNFLYVAIHMLLDLEKEVIAYGAAHGQTQLPQVRPTQLSGIEINPFAQELAQVVIWIGYLQWIHHNGFNPPRNPVLDPIESIQNRDAILDLSDSERPIEPDWPEADYIVGNPPFLGDKKLRGGLGDEYVDALFNLYGDRVPNQSDLCCYWFEKSMAQVSKGQCKRVGLLATQAIRSPANRQVLRRVKEGGAIFFAESNRPWILDGAAVRISMVGFDDKTENDRKLDGVAVTEISETLSTDRLADAAPLSENEGICFLGSCKGGPFDISEEDALQFLAAPLNINRRPNSDVVRLLANGKCIVQRTPLAWLIDFASFDVEEASKFELPFEYVLKHVKPVRDQNRDAWLKQNWWRPQRMRPEMRAAVSSFRRFAVTPEVAKHRVFVFLASEILPDHKLHVFARDEDAFLGILHSRIHEVWSTEMGALHAGERRTYNNTRCFDNFPFPQTSESQAGAISGVMREIDRLRNDWLNPSEWTREEILEFPGSTDGPWKWYVQNANAQGIGTVRYPRLVPKDAATAKQLAKRTLTKLYNQCPTWLKLAHRRLDEAVCAAYGWKPDLTDDEILEKLLALNLERAAAER